LKHFRNQWSNRERDRKRKAEPIIGTEKVQGRMGGKGIERLDNSSRAGWKLAVGDEGGGRSQLKEVAVRCRLVSSGKAGNWRKSTRGQC